MIRRFFVALTTPLATAGFPGVARRASIYKNEKFSDHALLTIGKGDASGRHFTQRDCIITGRW